MRKLFLLIMFFPITFSVTFSQEAYWITTWGMESQDIYTTDSHIDNNGNIYTIGYNSNTGPDTLYSCIINKFSSVGTHEFTKKFYTGGVGQNPIITSDVERNIYVFADVYIRKLTESGELLLEFPYYNIFTATKMSVDSANNLYVYGTIDDNDNSNVGPGIIKYNSEGVEIWDFVAFPLLLGQSGFISDVFVDSENNSIITGYLTKSEGQSIFIASIDNNGLMNWQNEFSIQDKSIMTANKIVKMSNGNYGITGYCGRQYYENTYDAITISFLDDGSLSWYKIFDLDSEQDQAFDIKAYNSGVVISGLGTTNDEKTMFTTYYDVNGTEVWSYNDAPKIWRESFTFNSFPPNSTSIIVDNLDIIVSGALDYGGGNSTYISVKIDNLGQLAGNIFFESDFLGTLDNSFQVNDKAVLICADLDDVTVDRFIKIINYDINSITTDIEKNNTPPTNYFLFQNYPNPFNPSTIINYQIPKAGFVTLKVFDVLGREVAELVNERKSAGSHKVKFNAENLSSGIYYYTISTNDFKQTKKMLLLK
jgi:hypothetical protein